MDRMYRAFLLLFAIGAAAQAMPSHAQQSGSIFKWHEGIKSVDFDDPKLAKISVWQSVSEFVVVDPQSNEVEQLEAVVRAALESGRAVAITYDGLDGRVDEASGRMVYPICTASLDETSFRSRHGCIDRAVNVASLKGQQALAVAIAQSEVGDAAKGRAMLDRVLAAPDLSEAAKIIALKARVSALESIGEAADFAGPVADEAHFAALNDSRTLSALRPDDRDAAVEIPRMLANLGDYDGAATGFREVIKKWPDWAGYLGVSLAATARQKGDFTQSLQLLDGVAADYPDQLGMRYYYHRSWTLFHLGRFDESVAAASEGMKTQADFPWAFVRRGCGYARVGQLTRARDDIDQGIMLLNRFAPSPRTKTFHENVEALTAVRTALTTGTGTKATTPNICDGFSGAGGERRPKSKLLG